VRFLRLAALPGLATAVIGCTAALKPPPSLSELGAGDDPPVAISSAEASARLVEAEDELARASDPASVERARELFLEAARAEPAPVAALLGAARATARLVEHEPDAERRRELAIEGVQIGQLCLAAHPASPECGYRLALAVGQQARERSSTAVDGLDVMVELLEDVIAMAPDLDLAGGHRLLALVLLRSPGWPTGPGDPELGLEHARAAVAAFPDHPPNQLVLGEALLENGDRDGARGALERGVALASAEGADPEAAAWLAEAEAALDAVR
jgi:hypothetical protein